MNKSEEQEIKKEFQLERVILFSDAVFAIIITIMVLDIHLPEDIKHADFKHIRHAFFELIPKAMAYGLSFFLVSKFWLTHLKMFSHLKDYDTTLLGFNLLYLFSVSLFPFAVTLISGNLSVNSPSYAWGINTYAGIILMSTLSQALLGRYLYKNRERLCFEPDKLDALLKYKVMRYNFYTIPMAIVIMVIITNLDVPATFSMIALGIYGFTMARLYKKNYPDSGKEPFIKQLFTAAGKRIMRRKKTGELAAKED